MNLYHILPCTPYRMLPEPTKNHLYIPMSASASVIYSWNHRHNHFISGSKWVNFCQQCLLSGVQYCTQTSWILHRIFAFGGSWNLQVLGNKKVLLATSKLLKQMVKDTMKDLHHAWKACIQKFKNQKRSPGSPTTKRFAHFLGCGSGIDSMTVSS